MAQNQAHGNCHGKGPPQLAPDLVRPAGSTAQRPGLLSFLALPFFLSFLARLSALPSCRVTTWAPGWVLSLAGLFHFVARAPFFGPSPAAWPASSFICWPFLSSFFAFCFLPTWCTCQAGFSFWLPKQHGLLTLVPLHANAILPCRPHVPHVKLSPAQASTREGRSEC